MDSIAIIGGGISGLSIAHCLKDRFYVQVYEKDDRPGGLIKCDRVNGFLYHKVGGHVFNSRRNDVLDWFWHFFDREKEFTKAVRNSTIVLESGLLVGYPIENNMYMLDEATLKNFVHDIVGIARKEAKTPQNFEEFLRQTFGDTLYNIYFQPYNEKIWRDNLQNVPISWLEGKLPMPSVEEMIYNNIHHVREMNMVHSSFYYAKENGSQFLANRLAEKLQIEYNQGITEIKKVKGKWVINDAVYDKVIFCGNIKELPRIIKDFDISSFEKDINELKYHGTTSVLCKIEKNPYSWIYLPSRQHLSHRIICTGNFAESNNSKGDMSATIEFTDYMSKEDIMENLQKIPFFPQYVAHQYTEYTYPIQNAETRKMLEALKQKLESSNMYLLGRFAEWEYYNMDAAMGAAIDLSKRIN